MSTTELLNTCLETNLPAAFEGGAEGGSSTLDEGTITDDVWTQTLSACAANLHPESQTAAETISAAGVSSVGTAEVWNPIHDPDRVNRWAEFSLPNTRLYKNNPLTQWMMFVYQNQNDRVLYFFSNDVAWNLGHEKPHIAVENLVPVRNKKSIPIGSGIFLTKEGVQEFIDITPDNPDKAVFVAWFKAYVEKCEFNTEINLENTCPA